MSICILTDSAVQFPNPVFEGRNLVSILPTLWEENSGIKWQSDLKAADLPQSVQTEKAPKLKMTSVQEFEDAFRQLGSHCEGVLALFSSAQFDESYSLAVEAAEILQGSVAIRVVDSKTTSLGLGMLVQIAAKAAEEEQGLSDLELHIRSLIPRVYTLLCIPSISYLHRRGFINASQALVGEYLGMLPVFTLDDGELIPSEKARNNRHLVDIMQEFLAEFAELQHIALLQGTPSFEQETRALRERLAEDHASTPISEQIISAPLASMIGPHSLGIFALQAEQ